MQLTIYCHVSAKSQSMYYMLIYFLELLTLAEKTIYELEAEVEDLFFRLMVRILDRMYC